MARTRPTHSFAALPSIARQSSWAWEIRGGLALLAMLVGGCAVVFSVAQAVVVDDPSLAHGLVPYDGRITAIYAASLIGPDGRGGTHKHVDALAQRALRQDPTAVVAVSTLGVDAQINGMTPAARRYFAYAQRLSRRDVRTQLWAIEDAVSRGDIREALEHYDIGLRTTARGGDLFFPILASANMVPEVRVQLVRKLATRPPWGDGFANYLAGSGLDPRPAATLFLQLRRAGVPISSQAQADIVEALINGGFAEEAWVYYAAVRKGTDRRRSRDPRFTATGDHPALFDWEPVTADGIAATIQGGVFDFSVPVGAAGVLLRQVQMLPPGTYSLSGHSIAIEQEERAQPYWTLTCGREGRELGRVRVPNSATGNGRFDGTFVVPRECPLQVLSFVARPSEATGGLSGQIDRLELSPAS